jgi:hypothetical protein
MHRDDLLKEVYNYEKESAKASGAKPCFVLFVNISCSFLFVIVIFSSFLFGCHGYFEVEIDDDVTSQI